MKNISEEVLAELRAATDAELRGIESPGTCALKDWEAAVKAGLVQFKETGAMLTEKGDAWVAAVHEIAQSLDKGELDCLQLSAVIPWVDLRGTRVATGIINERGKRTPLGTFVLSLRRPEDLGKNETEEA